MKILHISTGDTTGAGLCALRINDSLCSIGVESRLLVRCSKSGNQNVIGVYGKFRCFIHDAFHKLLRLVHVYVFEEDQLIKLSIEKGASFTRPVTSLDISNHPLVQWADIIHLHWVDNFFDQKKFLEVVKKPIVWTLHDEGFFYGISHHHDFFNLDNKIEKKYFSLKENMFSQRNQLSLVFLSKHFERAFVNHPFVQGKDFEVINNSVDGKSFYRQDRKNVRTQLGLLETDTVFSFVAGRINDVHKGLDKLINAIDYISGKSVKILAIGGNPNSINNDRVITVGEIKGAERMAQLLSASDYLVMPSLQEAFSQVPLEAMACGVPVVAFPVSGTEELITDVNGVRCKGFEVEDLVEGLNKAFGRTYDHKLIREEVMKKFSPEVIAKEYLSVYESLIKKSTTYVK